MSQESFERIVGKIVLDANFRDALLADPDRALSRFDLTESEKARIKRLDSETMEALAQTLADRFPKNNPASWDTFLYGRKQQGE